MQDILTLITKNVSFTPYDVAWIPASTRVCAIGTTERATGKIAIYTIQDNMLFLANETETDTAIRCGTLGAADAHTRQLATGDFEGQLQLWDTQRMEIPVASVKAHDTLINAIDGAGGVISPGGARELVTGGRDGFVKVWDTREPTKPVFTVRPHQETSPQDVWCVAFGNIDNGTQRLVAVGYANGDIKLFDLTASKYIWETHVNEGVCSIEFSTTPWDQLTVSTLGGLYVLRLSTGKSTKLNTPADVTFWSACHCPQVPDLLAVAGGDGELRLWKGGENSPAATTSVSKHPIVSLDWNRDKKGLFVCSSFDQTLRLGLVRGI
ncbi:WD40-repeat-containing domain protein [Phycomyces blakesleeanus]